MKVRWDPSQQRFPALAGKLVVDTYRGQMRVRAWPKKRGTPKSEKVRRQNAWFKDANELAKVIEPTQQNLAIAMTLGTGLYPRDLILRQMAGGMYEVISPDGQPILPRNRFREKVVFQGVALELLASQTLILNALTLITWPLPVLDTLGFWDVATPSRITVPAGIPVIKLEAGWGAVNTAPGKRQIIALYKNGVLFRVDDSVIFTSVGQTINSGVLVVAPGDFFEVKCRCTTANSALGSGRSHFSMTVLEAV